MLAGIQHWRALVLLPAPFFNFIAESNLYGNINVIAFKIKFILANFMDKKLNNQILLKKTKIKTDNLSLRRELEEFYVILFPPAKEVRGKVMFLRVFVCSQGGYDVTSCLVLCARAQNPVLNDVTGITVLRGMT